MTFVIVGNATQGFRRLLDAVDELVGTGASGLEPVFIQAGYNVGFQPAHCGTVPFLSMEEFQRWMEEADLIITHGGCGTILEALRLGKVPVVMPRRRKYGEHVNDHQMQLVEALAAEGWVVPVYEPGNLRNAIERARMCGKRVGHRPQSEMAALVGQAIDELIRLG